MQNIKQKIQQEKYNYPYHYIPRYNNNIFEKVQYWGTGHRYVANIKIIFDILDKIKFNNLLDIGTGDGRIIREIYDRYDIDDLLGIDYYPKPISIAKAMNYDIKDKFKVEDISKKTTEKCYDVVSLINVLEQIPIDDIDNFIYFCSCYLKKDSYFIITVPSDNKQVFGAAYQHFNEEKIRNLLDNLFYDIKIIFFDDIKSPFLNIFHKILGGYNGQNFIITNKYLNYKFMDIYLKKYLYTNKSRCGRIAVVCKKK